MKVTVITGSPHKMGTTALLADQFIEGAREAGHDVNRFDSAFESVKPCMACEYCSVHDGECVHKDDMNGLSLKILESDLIVFVTPLYYYGMSAQIKAVIDRFHANNAKLAGTKKAMLLAAAYGAEEWTMEALEKMYESMLRFLSWQDAGKLFAGGCPVIYYLYFTSETGCQWSGGCFYPCYRTVSHFPGGRQSAGSYGGRNPADVDRNRQYFRFGLQYNLRY